MNHSGSLGEASKEVKSVTRLNTKMAVRGTKTDQCVVISHRDTIIAKGLQIMKAVLRFRRNEATATESLTKMKSSRVITSVDR